MAIGTFIEARGYTQERGIWYMASKEQLHQLVDRLPENEIPTALHVLAALALTDPALLAALSAPDDDEPYTEEQQREDEQARAAFDRGEGIPFEEIKREIGL